MEANREDFGKRQLSRKLAEAITDEYRCEAERKRAVKNDIIPYLITALIESDFDSSANQANQRQAQQEDQPLIPNTVPIAESPQLEGNRAMSACYEVRGAKLQKQTRVLIRVNLKGKPLAERNRNTFAGQRPEIEPFSSVASECVRKLALSKLNYQSSFWRLRAAHNWQAA